MCQVVCGKLDSILLNPEGGGFISLESFIIFFLRDENLSLYQK